MNILLVDDDRFVLAALNQNMPWALMGFTEVYSASNINQAKEVIRNNPVQILITDIDMPQGSGIDLVTWIREEKYDIQIIFLTNYADFTFAQKAVELQSLEYYLKPIEFDKLELIIKKAIAKVEETTIAKKAASFSSMWEDIEANISEHFWSTYIKREGACMPDELEAQLVRNHLTLKATDEFVIILFDLFPTTRSKENETKGLSSEFEDAFREILDEVLSPNDALLELNPTDGSFLAIKACIQPEPEPELHQLREYCKKLIAHMNKKYGASLSCYISNRVSFQTFHSGLEQLQSMSKDMVRCRDRVFLLSEYLPIQAEYTLPNLNLLDEYLQLEKRDLFIEYCKDYLSSLSSLNQLNYTVLVSFRIDIIQLIYSFLREKGILAHKLIQGKTNDTLLKLSTKSIESMVLYISYLVNTSLDYAAFSASDQSVASIICEYIDIHFAEDINRTSLAEIVYLDPDYTSRLFKKETGYSLVNYIIKKRIETAKHLLVHTDLTVNLIADKVGYGNYSYFTKLFKKEVGSTPVNYRRMKKLHLFP